MKGQTWILSSLNELLISFSVWKESFFLLETINGQVGSLYKFPPNQYLSSMNVLAHNVLCKQFFFFLSCNYFMRGLSVEGPPWLTVKEFRNGRFQRWGDMCRRTSSIAKEGGLLCIFSTYLSHTTLLSLKTELWQLSWLMTHDTCHFIILILLFKFTTNKIIYTLRNSFLIL